ncbi:dipicolinate synthase [Sporosarcina sp. Marseille-Q4063]|uniref:NAD-binding protein n=1 Tax=Sporosarcina sp. Marseille-Q4063 TaxID=2810514 RepID=UPI001BB0B527|nr:NAD-binding protein [Sporosarcina sp. Marseille-Q4063]QUW21889.1 dipicolinate synthase [Sporosarcina sp. Marseille-Q4063]
MSKEKWLFIGTDKRLSVCCKLMEKKGYVSLSIPTNTYTDELESLLTEFQPNHIVFPILEMGGSIPLQLLGEGTKLYTGVVSEEWKKRYKEAHYSIDSYLQDEIFIWENARITAEAFISVFYNEIGQTIDRKQFYVAGYGRVGKMVADSLKSLGAHVTVIARSDAQLGEAKMRGYNAEQFSNQLNMSEAYLVNTIPAQWFTKQFEVPNFIFDLASAPGCLREPSTIEYYRLLPGLPGKYFPVDAAISLSGALERIHRR